MYAIISYSDSLLLDALDLLIDYVSCMDCEICSIGRPLQLSPSDWDSGCESSVVQTET